MLRGCALNGRIYLAINPNQAFAPCEIFNKHIRHGMEYGPQCTSLMFIAFVFMYMYIYTYIYIYTSMSICLSMSLSLDISLDMKFALSSTVCVMPSAFYCALLYFTCLDLSLVGSHRDVCCHKRKLLRCLFYAWETGAAKSVVSLFAIYFPWGYLFITVCHSRACIYAITHTTNASKHQY